MSERCIDASVIVKLVLKGEPYRVTARRLVRESTAVLTFVKYLPDYP
ncbi:hypothetical protein H8E77_39850 [bacterium]|nr:hypothetical protein [bacterium]